MSKRLSCAALMLLMVGGLLAQLPNTELWLFKIETSKKTGQQLMEPLNITKRDGYDNQASFSNDGKKIFYTSIREDKQADIYCYDIKKKKAVQLTKTAISEYSPYQTPDGKFLTVVVVESDSSQTVHFVNSESGIHERKVDLDSVGYYTFLNEDTLVYYKLTDPHSLRYYVAKTLDDRFLGQLPARSFKAIDRHTLLYGLKDSASTTFYTYNFLLRKATRYASCATVSEDIVWQPGFGLVRSEGTALWRFDEQKNSWVMLFDLAPFHLKKITRFNFDPKTKYLVVTENL